MHRLAAGSKLIVASHNPGKVWEIEQLIAPYGLNAVSAATLGLAEPEETETTFQGNARIKAQAAAMNAGLPALADDSGLEVECLGGAPGIFSARWAGPGKDFGLAMQKVKEEIAIRGGWTGEKPRANFISVLCLAWPDGKADFFEGKVFGHLVWPPRGGNGFGYDPVFVPDGDTRTFGEMEPEQKYAISHRTRAFDAFKREALDQIELKPLLPTTGSRDVAAMAAAAASLSTRAEAAAFVARLKEDYVAHVEEWTNPRIDTFLDALAHTLAAQPETKEPAWRLLARALLEASSHE